MSEKITVIMEGTDLRNILNGKEWRSARIFQASEDLKSHYKTWDPKGEKVEIVVKSKKD